MRVRDLLLAVACALLGAGAAWSIRQLSGGSPPPAIDYSLMIVGLGSALVVARYGRLGPFDGQFGSPRLEVALHDQIVREAERARRYGREFALVAVRQRGGKPVRWTAVVRRVDDVIVCRRGTTVLVLPETTGDGALNLLRRVRELYGATLDGAIVACPRDGRTGEDLALLLLELVRQRTGPNEVAVERPGVIETLMPSA